MAGMGGSPTDRERVQRPDVSSEMPTDPQDHPYFQFFLPPSFPPSILLSRLGEHLLYAGLLLTTGNMKDEGDSLGNRQGQTIKSWHGKCFDEAGPSCQGSDRTPNSVNYTEP